MIRTKCTHDGYWRGGVQHYRVWTEFPDDQFSPEQLKALEAEERLLVEHMPDPEPDPEEGEGGEEGDEKAGKRQKGGNRSKSAPVDPENPS